MEKEWSQELIQAYGAFPIWTVTWYDCYVQHERLCQPYADAERIAREKHGRVSLTVLDCAICWPGPSGQAWF